MSTKYKIRDQSKLHFLSFAVVEWIDVFTRPQYKDVIIESLKYCQKEKGLLLYGYCIMTNHIHLIISSKEGYNQEDIIRDFKKFTSKKLVKLIESDTGESRKNWMLWMFKSAGEKNRNNQNFQFWRQDNHPIELSSNEMLDQKLDYLHDNPVEAGFVDQPEDYLYSSARNYSGIKGLIDVEFID